MEAFPATDLKPVRPFPANPSRPICRCFAPRGAVIHQARLCMKLSNRPAAVGRPTFQPVKTIVTGY
jgi:hypothetical protein